MDDIRLHMGMSVTAALDTLKNLTLHGGNIAAGGGGVAPERHRDEYLAWVETAEVQLRSLFGVELVPHIACSEEAPELDLRCLYPCEVLVTVPFGRNASSACRDVPSMESEVLERVQCSGHAHAHMKPDIVHPVPSS